MKHRLVTVWLLIIAGATTGYAAAVSLQATTPVGGLYALTKIDPTSIEPSVLSNPNVDGIALRYSWDELEPADGTFDWSGIDAAVAAAGAAGKRVSISVSAGYRTPAWVYAEGARSIHFVWDEKWGATLCSVQSTPVPWDAVFIAKWSAFARALGERYGTNPIVADLKLTGINYKSEETSLPHAAGGPIAGGACTSFNDVAAWVTAGYTRALVENAWLQIAAVWSQSSSKPFAAMLNPDGFPPIDEAGAIEQGRKSDYGTTSDLLSLGRALYPTRFIAQNNGLSPHWIWTPLAATGSSAPSGYQMVGPSGNQTDAQAALELALKGSAQFVEMYIPDIINPNLSGIMAAAHLRLAPATTLAPTAAASSIAPSVN